MAHRYWMFTENNPVTTHSEYADRFNEARQFRFLVFQEETGEGGTRHFQGPLGDLRSLIGQVTLDSSTSVPLHLSVETTPTPPTGNLDVGRMQSRLSTVKNKIRVLQDLGAM